ncbi:MAG: outer membrane lipoprotein carrier protein LolA [Burkholderia sp.]|nr:outer membrane lipoprotein carrier protein LolA [Burkholderia sp.]
MRQFYLFTRSIRLTYELFNPILIFILLIFFVCPAFSCGIDQLKAFVSQVHTAKGNFVQKIVKSYTSANNSKQAILNTETSNGTFIFSRPAKFIWSYQRPYQEVLQSDGNTLYIYDYDLNQVIEHSLSSEINSNPAAILFVSNLLLEKDYTLHNAGKKDEIEWINLIPKTKENIQFKKISIGFQANILKTMKLYDLFNNITLLTFSKVEINPILNNYQFKFIFPTCVDVIKG